MVPEEKNYVNKKVQSCGLLLSQNICLKKELCLETERKEALVEETKTQSLIIAQLKALLQSQTKPLYEVGHKWCRINRKK